MTARTTWQCSTCRDAGMQRGICSLRCPIIEGFLEARE